MRKTTQLDFQIDTALKYNYDVNGIFMSRSFFDALLDELEVLIPGLDEKTMIEYRGIKITITGSSGDYVTLLTSERESGFEAAAIAVTEAALDREYKRVKEILLRKNHDYGNSWQRHGLEGVFVRLSDKALRLETLSNGRTALVTDEATLDTLTDIVGYGLLGLLHERYSK